MSNLYLLPVAGLLGAWLHELVHAAAAVLVGGRVVEIDLWNLHVDFTAPSERRERLVLLAPAIVGLCALPVLLWLVSGGVALLVVLFGWGVFTLNGGTHGELSVVKFVVVKLMGVDGFRKHQQPD
jgi:hypothetical protein